MRLFSRKLADTGTYAILLQICGGLRNVVPGEYTLFRESCHISLSLLARRLGHNDATDLLRRQMAESIEVVVRAGELVGIRARELRAPNVRFNER